MLTFILGVALGLVIGGCLGVLAASLAVVAARSDEAAAKLIAQEDGNLGA